MFWCYFSYSIYLIFHPLFYVVIVGGVGSVLGVVYVVGAVVGAVVVDAVVVGGVVGGVIVVVVGGGVVGGVIVVVGGGVFVVVGGGVISVDFVDSGVVSYSGGVRLTPPKHSPTPPNFS